MPAIPSQGLVLNPTQSVAIQARYTPIDLGSDTGAIVLDALENGQSSRYRIELQGRANISGAHTDTFTQATQPKADILLVVDDSCSMDNEQRQLASNFMTFFQYAVSSALDYHIGVVTTTIEENCTSGSGVGPRMPCPGHSGVLRSIRTPQMTQIGPVLQPATPNVRQAFEQLVSVGTDGASTELGLEAAVLALTPPRAVVENAGFIRADAHLAVIVVTDAGEASLAPLSYYEDRLLGVKGFGRLSMFTFSAIGPFQSMPGSPCSYDSDGDPQRYAHLVARTRGIQEEICSSDWTGAIQALGRTAFGFRTVFFLGAVPNLAAGQALDVRINNNSVAGNGACAGSAPTGTWCFDAMSNSIRFSPTSAPIAGQTLSVTYNTGCF